MNRTRNDIISQAVNECLDAMYRAAQPSITLEEVRKNAEEGKYNDVPLYSQHYISKEEYEEIIEHFAHIYRIECDWSDYVQVVYEYLEKGGSKDKWIPERIDEDGNRHPGYRGYEKVPPIKTFIGEEHAQKVLETINICKDFYKFDRDYRTFYFNVCNFSPCSAKEPVKEFYKSQGIDIQFKKRIWNDDLEDYEYVIDNE